MQRYLLVPAILLSEKLAKGRVPMAMGSSSGAAGADSTMPEFWWQRAAANFKRQPLTHILIPLSAASVGWITNWLAVEMIFWPLEWLGIPIFRKPAQGPPTPIPTRELAAKSANLWQFVAVYNTISKKVAV